LGNAAGFCQEGGGGGVRRSFALVRAQAWHGRGAWSGGGARKFSPPRVAARASSSPSSSSSSAILPLLHLHRQGRRAIGVESARRRRRSERIKSIRSLRSKNPPLPRHLPSFAAEGMYEWGDLASDKSVCECVSVGWRHFISGGDDAHYFARKDEGRSATPFLILLRRPHRNGLLRRRRDLETDPRRRRFYLYER